MRRRVFSVLFAAAVLCLSGCAKPEGVDGNLTNGWPLPPQPKLPMPTAPACYDVSDQEPDTIGKWPAPVDCTRPHTVETVYLGQFSGTEASRTAPPPSGGAERRAAYEQCGREVKTYLGGDWRSGRLKLSLVLPSDLHWEAGARWFRCDLVEFKDYEDFGVAVSRTASVKNGLAGENALALGCVKVAANGDEIDRLDLVACASPHEGEFAGVYDHPEGEYPTDKAAREQADKNGCRQVIAAYAGVPYDGNLQYRTGVVTIAFSKAAWELGNRGVRCYLWAPKAVSGSLKGAGTGGLPIN